MQNPPAGFGDALLVTKDKLIGHYNKKKNRLFTEASKVCRGIGMALLVIPPLAAIQLPRMETGAGTSILWIAIELIIQIVGIGSIMSAFDHKDARTRTSNIVRFSVGIALTGAGTMLAASLAFDRLGSMPVAAAVLVSIAISYVFVALMKARTKKSAEWQGKILGFSLGEMCAEDTFDVHFEKAQIDINGAYPMVCRELTRMLMARHPQLQFMNREDDMGLEPLRQSKLSYKPEYLLNKYIARWIDD